MSGVSLPPGSPRPALAHTPTHRHTLAHAPCPSHRLPEARPGTAGTSPGGRGGRVCRSPRSLRGVNHFQSRVGTEVWAGVEDPGAQEGSPEATPEPRGGRGVRKSRYPRRREVVGLAEAGLCPRGAGRGWGRGWGGWDLRTPPPPPALPVAAQYCTPGFAQIPSEEAEDGSWLLSDPVRQPFCGIKA